MALRVIITMLCGVGLYASVFMLRKGAAAARGELTERSVVQTPRARLLGNIPNALFGVAYYPALAVAIWLATHRLTLSLVAVPVLVAAAMSIVLAYSLLFVTRMPCPFCWTSHAINWTLLLCVALLLVAQ